MLYSQLVQLYKQLESTTKRLQKTNYLAQFLTTIQDDEIEHIMLLTQGRAFPQWDARVIGLADKSLVKAIIIATGKTAEEIEQTWKTTGDLGNTAATTIATKKQATLFSEPLTTKKVFENLQKTASIEGEGTVDRKLQLIAELLTSATPEEARYLVRTFLEDLRIGLGDGSIRDAIVWACFGTELQLNYDEKENELNLNEEQRQTYNKYVQAVQDACDLSNDFAQVILLARKGMEELKKTSLEPGKPCNVMLYPKAKNIKEAFETVGTPAAFEYKYDGFRLQIHKNEDDVKLFTRRLENVTQQFPDVVSAVMAAVTAITCIIDAEIVGIDLMTGKYIPFQNISQRIKRKHDIAAMAQKYPVEINAFDIIYYEGTALLDKEFSQRRQILTKIITHCDKKITTAHQKIIHEDKEAEQFYQQALSLGFEGIMIKSLKGIYKPGTRVGYGVKLKPIMETLDVVIVGAEWGEGKRSEWLSSFMIAVRDEKGEIVEIGKVGTGIKEKDEEGISFNYFTEVLKPHITKQEGKTVLVKPIVIIEVAYEEIQQSPTYNSGYALRFPRFVRIRDDKSLQNISTKQDVEKLYKEQRGRGANKFYIT